MQRVYGNLRKQIFSGIREFNMDSLQDLRDNEESIRMGRNGAFLKFVGNYKVNMPDGIVTSVFVQMNNLDNGTIIGCTYNQPNSGEISEFSSDSTYSVAFAPELIESGKFMNVENEFYIQNPKVYMPNISLIPSSFLENFKEEDREGKLELGLCIVDCEIGLNQTQKRRTKGKKNFGQLVDVMSG